MAGQVEPNVYVVRWEHHRWKVRHNDVTLSGHGAKAHAIVAGVTAARANRPSVLEICYQDGAVERVLRYEAVKASRRS